MWCGNSAVARNTLESETTRLIQCYDRLRSVTHVGAYHTHVLGPIIHTCWGLSYTRFSGLSYKRVGAYHTHVLGPIIHKCWGPIIHTCWGLSYTHVGAYHTHVLGPIIHTCWGLSYTHVGAYHTHMSGAYHIPRAPITTETCISRPDDQQDDLVYAHRPTWETELAQNPCSQKVGRGLGTNDGELAGKVAVRARTKCWQ